MRKEITSKDMVYFLLLSAILTLCVIIANKIETKAITPEVTEITTEATTEQISTVEETTDIPLTTVKFEDIPDYTELGTFKLTAYCSCSKCCGKSDGITASGKKATANRTVAVDRSLIPFGTELYIPYLSDEYYIAEDTGVNGMVIDVYFDSHEEALNFGVKYAKVYEVN